VRIAFSLVVRIPVNLDSDRVVEIVEGIIVLCSVIIIVVGILLRIMVELIVDFVVGIELSIVVII
jgi:hypothetical protein